MTNMRKQRKKMSETNLDTISIKPNDSTAEEMSEREFRMYIIKTIREANEEMKEQMQALKEEMKEDKLSCHYQTLLTEPVVPYFFLISYIILFNGELYFSIFPAGIS